MPHATPLTLTNALLRHNIGGQFDGCGLIDSCLPRLVVPPMLASKHCNDGGLVDIYWGLSTITWFKCSAACTVGTAHNLSFVDTIHAMSLIQNNLAPPLIQHFLNDICLTQKSQPWSSLYKSVFVIMPVSLLQAIHRLITVHKLFYFQSYWKGLHIDIPAMFN